MLSKEKVKEIVDFFGAEISKDNNSSTIMADGKEIEITDELSDKMLSEAYVNESDECEFSDEITDCLSAKIRINSNEKELREVSDLSITCKAA